MRERWRGRWWEREWQQLERQRERELKEETEGQREWKMEREGSGERMCLIIQHYPCSLFMALLEQPVEAIYTHTVGRGCSLKYSSPGKFQPKKQRKHKEKRDYILIREMRRRKAWRNEGGMNRQRRKNKERELPRRCKMRKGDRDRSQAKIIFSLRLLVYHCSWPNYFLLTGKLQQKKTTRQFLIEKIC